MKKYKNLTITDTNGADCLIVDPRRFGDARGFFESVTIDELNHLGFTKFNQFSDSMSGKGIL
jgi:dTDP-4-dehydrorhamnose 3,5-epimerase-like enzyme